jgi:putative sigma-54 modulation protein
MPVRITGRHLEITDDVRNLIEKKLSRIDKYTERVQGIEIILERDNRYQHRTELFVKDGPISVTAKTKDPDLLKAIDMLIDKTERQLKKKWDKMRGNTKQKGKVAKRIPAEEVLADSGDGDVAVAAAPRTRVRKAVATRSKRALPVEVEKLDLHVFPPEKIEAESMSIEHAAEELFFRDENFLCFRSESGGKLLVLYRRKDGNFGILEPSLK